MEVVLPTIQKGEPLASKLVRLVVLASVQMNPGETLERLRGVRGRILSSAWENDAFKCSTA